MVCCCRRGQRPGTGGLLGSWLLIAVLVNCSFFGSTTVFLAVDAARTSAFMAMAPQPAVAMAPSPSGLGSSKRVVPTGANPLHNR
ncbi:hypothetical protein BRADI_1g67505v3 [Brachypodium distachyon]|uniref:Uncharacterized protein n=1 Tax=Brachypodium distachyon TaxID=15368 RepID=A0A2K2DTV4_BRADI|nr:hypothetical protein BRADI_1g67505v3 [Brachypodium distachyon]